MENIDLSHGSTAHWFLWVLAEKGDSLQLRFHNNNGQSSCISLPVEIVQTRVMQGVVGKAGHCSIAFIAEPCIAQTRACSWQALIDDTLKELPRTEEPNRCKDRIVRLGQRLRSFSEQKNSFGVVHSLGKSCVFNHSSETRRRGFCVFEVLCWVFYLCFDMFRSDMIRLCMF